MEASNPAFFGILATGILMATLGAQTLKMWRENATRGIARWFFLGQVSASACFFIYSMMIGSTVFAVANALVLLGAVAGYLVLRANRRRAVQQMLPPRPAREFISGAHPSRVAMF